MSTTYKITALDDYVESKNLLVHADPGAGKTVLGGTAPNALILATEKGTISAKRQGSTVALVDVRDHRRMRAVIADLRRGRLLLPTGLPPEWIVVDTLNRAQENLADDIMRSAHADNSQRSADILDMLGHQIWQSHFKKMVNALNDLDQNVLYLAHSSRIEDEEGDPLILPDIKGKNGTQDATTMSRWVCATVDLVGYLQVSKKTDRRQLMVRREGPYVAKDRYDAFPDGKIPDPNIADMAAAIDAALATKPSKKNRKED